MPKTAPAPGLRRQVILFLIIGGFCYLLNIALLWVAVEFLAMEENLANLITSVIVTYVAYLLNKAFIFESGRHAQWKEISGFFVFAFIGLGLNVFLFYLGTAFTPIHYIIIKSVVTVIVAAFNFITRKLLIFKS